MLVPPVDFDESHLLQALQERWGFAGAQLAYNPVGSGSHHWLAKSHTGQELFVKADAFDEPVEFERLKAVYGTATVLRQQADLPFVVAPVATVDGTATWCAADKYVVTVYPLIDGTSGSFGDNWTRYERDEVLALLSLLHAATDTVVGIVPYDDVQIERRGDLVKVLQCLDSRWDTGPYGEPARSLLHPKAEAIRRALESCDKAAASVLASPDAWVVTHGEAHPGNFMRTDDALFLIDWETVLLAPPERDLWLVSSEVSDLEAYRSTRQRPVDVEALRFFELRWILVDIARCTAEFVSKHAESPNLREELDVLRESLDVLDLALDRLEDGLRDRDDLSL